MKREDLMLLIASFVIAVALWFQVQPMFEPGREREFIVPLKLENKPEELAVFPASDNVTLIATGSMADLDKIDASKITAYLDLANIPQGESKVPVQVRGPAESAVQIRPKAISMRVSAESILRVMRPVAVVTSGTPPDGLVLANTVANPAQVELYGPASYVNQVKALQATVDLNRLRPGQSINVPVAVLDAKGNPVPSTYTNPVQVTVAASFSASTADREVPVIVDWAGSVAPSHQIQEITVQPERVVVSGKSEAVSSVTIIDTEPLELRGLAQTKQYKLKLIAPEGITLKTAEVTVTIKLKRR